MKKFIFGFAMLAVCAFSFTSCEKCTTCTVLGVEQAEVCGKSSEIEDYEDSIDLLGGDCVRN
ncbi:MAG: hypothetical protein H7X71_05890 [Chitinophagales bacterium]|nr:hypothetical protein [Chitinophagales bacterium]